MCILSLHPPPRLLLHSTLSSLKAGTLAPAGAVGAGAASTTALGDPHGTVISLRVGPDANKVSMDVTWNTTAVGKAQTVAAVAPAPTAAPAGECTLLV